MSLLGLWKSPGQLDYVFAGLESGKPTKRYGTMFAKCGDGCGLGHSFWSMQQPAGFDTEQEARAYCEQWPQYASWIFDFGEVKPAKKQVIYVAHPVGKAPIDNAFRAVAWLRWLTKHDPTRIYIAPWIGEVLAFPGRPGDYNYRDWEDSISDDEAVLERCDGVLLVGGYVSPGMQRELNKAKECRLWITDMSQYSLPQDLPAGFELDV